MRSLELDDQPKHWPLREPRGKQSSESIKMVDFRITINASCTPNEFILFAQKTQEASKILKLRYCNIKT